MGGSNKPRVLLIRDAAVGDALMITPAIHDFAERGYDVHVACKKHVGAAVYAFNPHIASCHELPTSETMEQRQQRIDEIIARVKPDIHVDLAFSCEGAFLYHSDNPMYHESIELRRAIAQDTNYYEHINKRVLGCERTLPEMYIGAEEDRRWTQIRANTLGSIFIQVQLTGSSINKCYPFWPEVIKGLQQLSSRVIVITTGDPAIGPAFEAMCLIPGVNPRRMWPWCSEQKMTLRDSLVATKYVDLVIGPETGVVNAAACWDTPKLVLLTHSNCRNLTEGWKRCIPIQSPAKCSPCYRIVSAGDPCNYISDDENYDIAGAMRCMAEIPPELIINNARRALELC